MREYFISKISEIILSLDEKSLQTVYFFVMNIVKKFQ